MFDFLGELELENQRTKIKTSLVHLIKREKEFVSSRVRPHQKSQSSLVQEFIFEKNLRVH